MACSIACAITMFVVIDSIFLKPLNVPRPTELDRLVLSTRTQQLTQLPQVLVSRLETLRSYSGLCGYGNTVAVISYGTEASVETGALLEGDCFGTLEMRPAIGRLVTLVDEEQEARVVDISYRLYMRLLKIHGSPLGQDIAISGKAFTIVGVLPATFTGLLLGFPPDFYVPASSFLSGHGTFDILARRAPTVSRKQAQAELSAQSQRVLRLATDYSRFDDQRSSLLSSVLLAIDGSRGFDYFVRSELRTPVTILLLLSLVLLALSSANFSNLMVADAYRRRQQIAVRLALGAHRWHIFWVSARYLLSVIAVSTIIGILVARPLAAILIATYSSQYDGLTIPMVVDGRVTAYIVLMALSSVIISGSLPTLIACQVQPISLAVQSRTATRKTGTFRLLLLAVQLVCSIVLGATALDSRDYLRERPAASINEPRKLLEVELMSTPSSKKYRVGLGELISRAETRISLLPSIRNVCISDIAPFYTKPAVVSVSSSEGRSASAELVHISKECLTTLGLDFQQGSRLTANDANASSVIIGQTLATRLFGNEAALGLRIKLTSEGMAPLVGLEVTGVVRDIQLTKAEDTIVNTVYQIWSEKDGATDGTVLLVRLRQSNAGSAIQAIRSASYPGLVVSRIKAVSEQRQASLASRTLIKNLAFGFNCVALLLSAMAVYGTVQFVGEIRRKELGIRGALGASPQLLVRIVAREVIIAIAMAGAVGIGVSVTGGYFVRNRIAVDHVSTVSHSLMAVAFVSVLCVFITGALLLRIVAVEPGDLLREQ